MESCEGGPGNASTIRERFTSGQTRHGPWHPRSPGAGLGSTCVVGLACQDLADFEGLVRQTVFSVFHQWLLYKCPLVWLNILPWDTRAMSCCNHSIHRIHKVLSGQLNTVTFQKVFGVYNLSEVGGTWEGPSIVPHSQCLIASTLDG